MKRALDRRQSTRKKVRTGAIATPTESPREGFPIVGIGASAGGLEAFTRLLKRLSTDTGMGFVLVQHLDPDHESALVQILARSTSMPVQEAEDGLRIAPNHVYVIPPNTDMASVQGVLKLQRRQPGRAPHHSIDFFFDRRQRGPAQFRCERQDSRRPPFPAADGPPLLANGRKAVQPHSQ